MCRFRTLCRITGAILYAPRLHHFYRRKEYTGHGRHTSDASCQSRCSSQRRFYIQQEKQCNCLSARRTRKLSCLSHVDVRVNAWFAHTYLSGFELEYLSEFVTYFSMNKQILKQFARIFINRQKRSCLCHVWYSRFGSQITS